MDAKSLRKLEFHKILKQLEDRCGSSMGKAVACGLEIHTSREAAAMECGRTTEAVNFLDAHGSIWDFGLIGDIDDILLNLQSGRVLEPAELGRVRTILEFSGKVKGSKIEAEEFQNIHGLRAAIFAGSAIASKIASSIDSSAGAVLDSASPALLNARKSIRRLEKSIPDNLRRIINSPEMATVAQDRVVTMRGGRFVIPIKTDFAQAGKWVLQDRSASGSTSFVEPLETVEENNRLTRERLIEKSEVLRILRDLTSMLIEKMPELEASLEALGEIDCLLARGRLSRDMQAVEPEFDEGNHINIKSGRHPLLGEKAIPVDLHLGGGIKCLVITGPNAGGKTVSLKLAGLLQLMGQSGLHVPAAFGTRLGIFDDICVVMGDEQNIELSLSTFSSHLAEIRDILESADSGSLALIDEICSGTDPEEGAALACGILKELMARGATIVATSHQSGLKTFAGVTRGAENARMVFDEKQKVPVFRIEVGTPGKSYALELAERAGFEPRLVESAREYLSTQARMAERLLADLEEMKSFIDLERSAISDEKKEIEKEKSAAKKQADEARLEKEKVILKAFEEAQKIVAETKNRCREILRKAGDSEKTLPKEAELKGEIKIVAETIEAKKTRVARKQKRHVRPESLSPGMPLILRGTGETVKYVSGPDRKGRVRALLGALPITTDIKELFEAEPAGPSRPAPEKRDYSKYIADAKGRVKSSIDIHGMRVQEAYDALDAELESLSMAGAEQVRIFHGIGTGTLMRAVHEYLEKCPFVIRHEVCGLEEGGVGATRAWLK